MVKKGLEPLVDKNTRILILGSLPSDISISQGQYYANSGNDFWKIMSAVIGKDLVWMNYIGKRIALKNAGVGLWDVFRSANRNGSMDKDIDSAALNNFTSLNKKCPSLSAVYFNGKKAGEHIEVLETLGYPCYVLPSSSGANRSDMAGRLEAWKKMRNYLK